MGPDANATGDAMTETATDYVGDTPAAPKIRRTIIASLACAVLACAIVALIGFVLLFSAQTIGSITMGQRLNLGNPNDSPILTGIGMGLMMCAFNWFFFWIIIPVTWLVLGFTVGRMARKRNINRKAYFRTTAIVGGLLVGATTGFFGFAIDNNLVTGLVAGLTGAAVGAIGGCFCAFVFLAIVKIDRQILAQDVVEVF